MFNKEKKVNPLIKSSVIYVIATAIGQGISFLGIIVFTRLMGQAEYGEYSTYYAYVSILTVLIGGNLYYALNNAYIERKKEIKEFRKSVLVLSAFIMIVITVLLIAGDLALKRTSFFEIVMAVLHSYGFFVISYRMYSANMENDYRKKQWLLIMPNALQFVFSLTLILLLQDISYEARIIGSTVGVDVVALVAFAEMICCKGKFVQIDHWKYSLSIAFPTVVMSLSYMLMQQCDKVMIRNICGAEDTAVYSVIYYIGYVIAAVDQSVAPVRQAWIFLRLDGGDISEAKKIQKWYLLVMSAIVVGLIMAGPEMVKILAPKKYWKFEYVVPFVLSACMMFLYRFYVEVILFYKSNVALSVSVLICTLINVGLNAVLIPVFGAVVACYTTVVSYGILFIFTWILASRYIRGIYAWQYFIIFILGIIIMVFLYTFVQNLVIARYTIMVAALSTIVVYGIRSQKEWKRLLWEGK